jgi:acetyl esterase
MAKEYWYFISGMLVVLIPVLLMVAVKKLHLLEVRPDQKIVYAVNGSEKLTLHAFIAKRSTSATPTPALLLFHGGGWLYGGPEAFYPQCQYFAAQGISCFSAQYRLGANNQPDIRGAVADARAALDYLIAHASELHIDTDRIVVGGGSAGGQLAAALGSGLPTVPGVAALRPAAQILYNPILDLSPGHPNHHLVVDFWRDVSPFHHIDSTTPPTLILVGSEDLEVPVKTVQAYCAAIQTAQGYCEVSLYEGQGHGFYHHPEYLEKTNRRVVDFLRSSTK